MPDREFAPWVEPIARRDSGARAALLEFARSAPEDLWRRPSPLDGWACKDLLAHLAGDTGKWFAHILSSVLDGSPLDPKRAGPPADVDALNGSDVDGRRDRSIAELIAEIESDGEEHLDLLSRLTEDHRDYRLALYATTLADFLGGNPAGNRGGHDSEHLAQLRDALEVRS